MVVVQVVDGTQIGGDETAVLLALPRLGTAGQGGGVGIAPVPGNTGATDQRQAFDGAEGDLGIEAEFAILAAEVGLVGARGLAKRVGE